LIDLHALPWPRFCYIEIPATNPRKSAGFYRSVFGWNIRGADSDRPSFDDPNGISGAFVTYLKPRQEAGILPSIWIKDIESFLTKIAASGGEIVERPHPDEPGGVCLIATFRDPAGNILRLYEEPEN
jgi:predicted enzyme related to lactoylglutathione lyase